MTIAPLAPLPPATAPEAQAAARERARETRDVARDLEALLVTQMIAAMRRTVPSGGLLQASVARRTLDGAFDHELARALVAGGGVGIASQIERQIAAGTPAVAAPDRTPPASPAVERAAEVEPAAARPRGAQPEAAAGARAAIHREAVAAASPEGERAATVRAGAVAFRIPVEGRLTSDFGVRRDPFTGTERFHGGIDLAAPRGTPIRVAADGEVLFSGWGGGAGHVVVVRHTDGVTTSYAHTERPLVIAGQEVVAGDVIARVGSSGRSTGPHLHFAARRDGQVLDPHELFSDLADARGHG